MMKDEGRNQPNVEREKEKNPPHEHKRTSSNGKSGGLPANQWSKGGRDSEGGMIDGWKEK